MNNDDISKRLVEHFRSEDDEWKQIVASAENCAKARSFVSEYRTINANNEHGVFKGMIMRDKAKETFRTSDHCGQCPISER